MPTNHIVIGDISPRIRYTADGVQTAFTFPFPIFDIADIRVFQDDTAVPSGFTVTGAGQSAGGTVTFDTAPASGVAITLLRRLIAERTTDFEEGGAFRASVINDELDRQTAFIQDLSEGLDRAVKLPDTSPLSGILLPDAAASRALMWNATGDGLENSVDDVNGIVANATTQATNAAASATAAATSETTAGNAASAAGSSASAAAGSAWSAASSAAILPDPATGIQGQVPQINATLDGYALGSVSATDANVKVSADDTTAGNLEAKLLTGDGVVATTWNDGANETRTLAVRLADGETGLEFAGGGLRIAPAGPATVAAAAGDTILIADTSNAGALRGTTVQDILDLAGSDNITLNAFRIAINGGLSVQNMIDGFVDEFADESGVDAAGSTNETYNPTADYFGNLTAGTTEESASDTPADNGNNTGVFVDRSWALNNSETVVRLGFDTTGYVNSAAKVKIVERTAAGTYDVLVDVTVNHSGSGMEDFAIPAFDVPATGDFYVGAYYSHGVGVGVSTVSRARAVVLVTDITGTAQSIPESNGAAPFTKAIYGTATDMSLVSASVEAAAGPGDARVVLLVEPVDAVTINTDLKAWASRDDGMTWDLITLSDEGIFSGSRRVWAGPATLTPVSDQTMRWKVTIHNTKEVRLHGAALEWR